MKISTRCILTVNHYFLCQLNALNSNLVEIKVVIGGYVSYESNFLKHLLSYYRIFR